MGESAHTAGFRLSPSWNGQGYAATAKRLDRLYPNFRPKNAVTGMGTCILLILLVVSAYIADVLPVLADCLLPGQTRLINAGQ